MLILKINMMNKKSIGWVESLYVDIKDKYDEYRKYI